MTCPNTFNTHSKSFSVLVWVAALLALTPWLAVQTHAMIGGNVAWLLIAAERLLHGMSMSGGAFETNPPLSILIYIPSVIFSRLTGLPVPVGTALSVFALVALSTIAVGRILSAFPVLNANEKRAILFGYLSSVTILTTTIYFTDREHLIILALFPFILCQRALTEKIPLPRFLLYAVMLCGTIAVLVKPHYGLLPVALLAHRVIRQKRLSVIFDPDFVFLAIGTVSYIASIFLLFPDYVPVIFPDALDLYVVHKDVPMTMRYFQPVFIGTLALLLAEFLLEDIDKRKRHIAIFFYLCTLLALVPVLVQMKGYYNHLIPVFAFFAAGVSLSVLMRLERFMDRCSLLYILTPVVILTSAQIAMPPSKDWPRHKDVAGMSAAKFLKEECESPCTFFVFHNDTEIMNPTTVYMDYTHGSRFGTYWFVPRIVGQLEMIEKGEPTALSKERLLTLKKKYSLLAAQDLERFRPSVILIETNVKAFNNEDFDFLGFFAQNETYRDTFFGNYRKTGTFAFDRAEYFRGTTLNQSYILTYDIYKRREGPWKSASFSEDEQP